MITTKQELRDYLKADKHANGMDNHYWLKLLYGNDSARSYRYLRSLRYMEYSRNRGHLFVYYIWRFINRRIGLNYGISIAPNTVGKGLRISHLQGGVIINCFHMGENCTVAGGVVVGNKGSQENRATIGNNVELTLGCKVIGKVHVGDNVVVAPNSVVVKDVPNNAIVSGVPSQIIKIKEVNNESSSD